MGNTDSVPAVSQTKSLFQLACGDADGAKETQENFLKECPGVSQITSTVQLIQGDREGAVETQRRCGKGLLRMVDGIPVVGHTKGVIHYGFGDRDGGDQAMKSATRTTGVIAGGVGGFVVGGPVGAVAGGIAGGVGLDGVTTAVDSAIHEDFRPSGYIAAVNNIVVNPSAGGVFDLAIMPVADGVGGYGAANVGQTIQNPAVMEPESKMGPDNEWQAISLQEMTRGQKLNIQGNTIINPTPDEISKVVLEALPESVFLSPEVVQLEEDFSMPDEFLEYQRKAQELTNALNYDAVHTFEAIEVKEATSSTEPGVQLPQEIMTNPSLNTRSYTAVPPDDFIQVSFKALPEPEFPSTVVVPVASILSEDPMSLDFEDKGQKVILFALLDLDGGLAIVGSTERGLELTSSLFWDHKMFKIMCNAIGFDWQRAFGRQNLTLESAVNFILLCGGAKGYDAEMLTELIQQRKYKGTPKTRIRVEDVVEKLTHLSCPVSKARKKGKCNRGEHIINNRVLSVYRDIINRFLQITGLSLDSVGLALDCEFSKNYHHPVDRKIRAHIQDDLVARIPTDILYIDTNSLAYGTAIELLRGYAVQHMLALYSIARMEPGQGSQWTGPLREVIALINDNLLFVDQVALDHWRRRCPGDSDKYSNAKEAVVSMLTQLYDKLHDWVEQATSA